MTRRYILFVLPFAAFCLMSIGCGPSKGTVSGKVTHKGKAVVWGSVSLIGSDNIQYVGRITPEGTYSIPNVPGGPVKISVSSPSPEAAARNPAGGDGAGGGDPVSLPKPGAWFALPEQYSDPQKSGLTGVVRGDTTIDVDLP